MAIIVFITQFLSVLTGESLILSNITSNSMDPALVKGDIVAWMPAKMKDIEIGDIVVFKSYIKWPNEILIVHRVTDIKRDDKTGLTMLETKGDANEWNDQNDPYIQNPYIREDNLLGKVICVGQQPLKIPLIGYIGISLNEYYDLVVPPLSIF